jgi:hypothetical protein
MHNQLPINAKWKHILNVYQRHKQNIVHLIYKLRSWDSIVSIVTRYGLEGPGIESRWGEIFHTYPDWLWGSPSLLYNGYRVFPGGKGGRGLMPTTHPLLAPRLRKSWAIPPLTLWVLLGLLRGSLYPFYLQAHRCPSVHYGIGCNESQLGCTGDESHCRASQKCRRFSR